MPPRRNPDEGTDTDDRTEDTEDTGETDQHADGEHDDVDPDAGDDDADGQESDDSSDDDGGEDDAGDDEGSARQPAQVRDQGRGNRDIGRLRQERRELARERDQLREEVNRLRVGNGNAPVQQGNPADAARVLRERREQELETARLQGGDAYIETRLRHQQEDFDARLGNIAIQSSDAADRATYDAECRRNPVLDDLSGDVERELGNLRRQGGNAPRLTIAKFILGDRAMSRASRAKNKVKRQTDVDRAREKSRPGRGGSDVQDRGRRGGDDASRREERLKDLQI